MKHRDLIARWVLPVVMTLLLVPMLPHHHHNGEMCTAVEYCRRDHAMNDAHTIHHGDSSVCMAEGGYAYHDTSAAESHAKVLQAALWVAVVASIIALISMGHERQAQCKSWPGYKPADPYPHTHLRAPPYSL